MTTAPAARAAPARSSSWARRCSPARSPSGGPATSASAPDRTRILVTPTGVSLGALDADALSVIDLAGRHVDGAKPSKEAFLHAAVYRARPGRGRGRAPALHLLRGCLLPGRPRPGRRAAAADRLLRDAGRSAAAAALPRSGRRTRSSRWPRQIAADHRAFLLANHGPVVAGADLASAADAVEELEETARLFLLLRGHPTRPLTADRSPT